MYQGHNQQKVYVDRKNIDRNFEVGDMMYLRLQPNKKYPSRDVGKEISSLNSMDLTKLSRK